MRVFVSTFFDIPEDRANECRLTRAHEVFNFSMGEITVVIDGLNDLSEHAHSLINNMEVNFCDNSDEE